MNQRFSFLYILAATVGFVLLCSSVFGNPTFNEAVAGIEAPGQNDLARPATMPSIGELMNVIDQAATDEGEKQDWSTPVKMVVIFGALAILPSLLVLMTSFTRIIIVLSFARKALGTQTIPPNIAVIGLALFLTIFTMAPTFAIINETAVQPYLQEEITFDQAGIKAGEGIKEFMLNQTRQGDLKLFIEMSRTEVPETVEDLGLHIVVPSFVVSEFRTAFEMGCLLFIPFLLIDLIIAGILLSAGMMMLPPVMISLPFKLILFILVDGWTLLARSLSLGFN